MGDAGPGRVRVGVGGEVYEVGRGDGDGRPDGHPPCWWSGGAALGAGEEAGIRVRLVQGRRLQGSMRQLRVPGTRWGPMRAPYV